MIANARMYSVSPEAAGLWRGLLPAVIEHAGLDIDQLEHTEPAPINELWQRPDMAAVFMCGLPFSRSAAPPEPIPAPPPVLAPGCPPGPHGGAGPLAAGFSGPAAILERDGGPKGQRLSHHRGHF